MRSTTVKLSRANPGTAEVPLDVQWMNSLARLLFAVALITFAAWAVAGLARLPMFTLRRIDITGDTARYTPAVIRAAVLPRLKGNFFTLDLRQAQASFQTLPWVRHAIVRRIWPDRLLVTLEEHHAAAIWQREDDDDQLVNTEGEIFDANTGDVEDDNLPTFTAPDATDAPQVLQMYQRLSDVLAPLDAHIDSVRLSERGSWSLTLDTGADIELGRGDADAVTDRARNFMATIDQVLQRYRRPLEYADLRYPKGYAVRLQGVSTGTVPPAQGRNPS